MSGSSVRNVDRRRFIQAASACGFCAMGLHRAMAATPASANVVGENWYPSKYGPNDQIGAANLVTPTVVREALALVRQGRVLSLGIELNTRTPGIPPRKFEHWLLENIGSKHSNADDVVFASLNTGTQMDGLAHMGVDAVFYNGHRYDDIFAMEGLKKLGTENIPPIVTRALLLDMAALKGRSLRAGEVIAPSDVRSALSRIGKQIRKGDVVLFHTGWMERLRAGDPRYAQEQPGPGVDVANELCEAGVVGLGSDTSRLEVYPHERPGLVFPVHQICLAKHGVYVLENFNTQPLVEAAVAEFCISLAPTRVSGASQTWVNPVAMF